MRASRTRLRLEPLEKRLLLAGDFLDGEVVGHIAESQVTEASGLVASRQNEDVFWVHNDSGDSARLFAMNRSGTHLGVYTIDGATAVDWEDIAIGPGPAPGIDYLYIADMGDNGGTRSSVTVYRIPEPFVQLDQQPVTVNLTGAESLEFVYSDGSRDAETLLVDPLSGDIVVVSKREAASRVYKAEYPQSTSATNTFQYVGDLTFSWATGGDVSALGDEVLVKSSDTVTMYDRVPGANLWGALLTLGTNVPYTVEPQGEAISFDADGNYYTVSEGSQQPIYFYQRIDPNNTSPESVIPIDDRVVDMDAANEEIPLLNHFSDADGDEVTFTVLNNDNPTLVNASIVGPLLTLDYLDQQHGVANVTIRATDPSGAWAEDSFQRTVTGVSVDRAMAEITEQGAVMESSYLDTHVSDNEYEKILEELFAGGKRSRLKHQWEFELPGADTVKFVVEAHHNSSTENFNFEFSPDGAIWTPLLTVTGSADATYEAPLPPGTAATIYIRAVDTTVRDSHAATLYVDNMYIESETTSPPPPPPPSSGGNAIAETTTAGVAVGGLDASRDDDDLYETITEETFAGGKRSRLEHTWEFSLDAGDYTFNVDAHIDDGTVETYVFDYSTDGVNWQSMNIEVDNTGQDQTRTYDLAEFGGGTIFVRVTDTDRSRKEPSQDTIYVDEVVFQPSGSP
jgi:hypothetical protein